MNIILRLAWRNLWRHPRRTWLTTAAMVFANVLLVFMISLQFGMYSLMIDNTLQALTGHMQIQAPGYKDDMKMRQVVHNARPLAASMRKGLNLPGVAARGVAFALVSSEDRSYGIQIFGVEPQFEPGVSSIPGLSVQGRYLQKIDVAEIVICSVLARNLRVDLGDELTLLGSGLDGSFAAGIVTIVGIFKSGINDLDRGIVEIPLGYFQEMFYMLGNAHQVVINTSDLSLVGKIKKQAEDLLPAGDKLVIHDWNVLQPGLRQAIIADISSAFFMYTVLVILVAFSVLNTQLMSVLERTREFGIVMALGLTPGRLGRLVLLETAMMGAMGFAFGVLTGGLVTLWFSVNGFSFPGMDEMAANFNLPSQFHPQVSFLTLLIGPSVVFVFTLLAALYPMLRLRWLHPVEAMRAY